MLPTRNPSDGGQVGQNTDLHPVYDLFAELEMEFGLREAAPGTYTDSRPAPETSPVRARQEQAAQPHAAAQEVLEIEKRTALDNAGSQQTSCAPVSEHPRTKQTARMTTGAKKGTAPSTKGENAQRESRGRPGRDSKSSDESEDLTDGGVSAHATTENSAIDEGGSNEPDDGSASS